MQESKLTSPEPEDVVQNIEPGLFEDLHKLLISGKNSGPKKGLPVSETTGFSFSSKVRTDDSENIPNKMLEALVKTLILIRLPGTFTIQFNFRELSELESVITKFLDNGIKTSFYQQNKILIESYKRESIRTFKPGTDEISIELGMDPCYVGNCILVSALDYNSNVKRDHERTIIIGHIEKKMLENLLKTDKYSGRASFSDNFNKKEFLKLRFAIIRFLDQGIIQSPTDL